jgi:hypothetical protein
MTHDELRTLTAAVILSGLFANKDATVRDIEVQEAVLSADALIEALRDIEPIKKRIAEWSEKRRETSIHLKESYAPKGWYPQG